MKGLYMAHGNLCISHPWEVIVATIAVIACIFSIDASKFITFASTYQTSSNKDPNEIDVVVMTSIRCAAIVYSFIQFCNLQKMESKFIGIAAIFTVISSLIFFSSVLSYFSAEYSDLKDGLCFFILLMNLTKASALAQYAFSASLKADIKHNIAHGISMLGPTVTLDTVVKVLMLSTGSLLGIQRLEILCNFARMSVVVNYVVFMTFYPSSLSLILELTKHGQSKSISQSRQNSKLKEKYLQEILKSNPVLQRLKLIMSMGIIMVHFLCQWSERELNSYHGSLPFIEEKFQYEDSNYTSQVTELSWVTLTTDNIVYLFLLLALGVKFVFLEEDEASNDYGCADKNCLGHEVKSREKITQTDGAVNDNISHDSSVDVSDNNCNKYSYTKRSLNECIEIYKEALGEILNDEDVELLVQKNVIQIYQLEKVVNNSERGVKLRRKIIGSNGGFENVFDDIPYKGYDYSKVLGACCENIVGYIPIPLGIAGPLKLDNEMINVPLATTEGCLVASTNRGCRALLRNGITSRVVGDGMTRGPVVRFNSLSRASEAMLWIKHSDNFIKIKESFDSTSRYARLMSIHIRIAGRYLFIRFVATTGDAMGMNMVSKGTEAALHFVHETFPDMEVISLSGNFCSDKKPAAVNWIDGRGKYVVCEAIVPHHIVKTVLKTTVNSLVDVNINKNLVGSAIAGSIGGYNAHAANIVTAIYIATGQDPAQNIGSSNCITLMEPWGENGQDLYISCTMPSIEIGTVGGGTQLSPQAACLDMLGVKGANEDVPGENANKLARIVCGSVLAGELSLMSALAAGHLVKSHLRHNRSSADVKDLTQYNAENVCSSYR
ncbi:3-hydroxy-3-methylglutaryl-coenzyme A reductase isoform X2 [Halyomorpha halys]|nr:3-hydroxy-3-methylglutaryl-coenzyme A reductase-like isoform X2 [Halyomorpha halys]